MPKSWSFFVVSAIDQSAEYPGLTGCYVKESELGNPPQRFATAELAETVMALQCARHRSGWWFEVERWVSTWTTDRGFGWWVDSTDYDYDGAKAWWNDDDSKVEIEKGESSAR